MHRYSRYSSIDSAVARRQFRPPDKAKDTDTDTDRVGDTKRQSHNRCLRQTRCQKRCQFILQKQHTNYVNRERKHKKKEAEEWENTLRNSPAAN